jgi:hypothetical protein
LVYRYQSDNPLMSENIRWGLLVCCSVVLS